MSRHLILMFTVLGLIIFLLVSRQFPQDVSTLEKREHSQAYNKSTTNLKSSPKTDKALNVIEQASQGSVSKSFSKAVNTDISIPGASKINLSAIESAKTKSSSFFEGTPWEIWLGVKAYPKNLNKPAGRILGEVMGYYLVEESDLNLNSDLETFSSDAPLVVVQQLLGVAAVVTGVFIVTVKEGFSGEFLEGLENIKILNSFPAIRTYFVTSNKDVFSLQSVQTLIKNHPAVAHVEVEILGQDHEKN